MPQITAKRVGVRRYVSYVITALASLPMIVFLLWLVVRCVTISYSFEWVGGDGRAWEEMRELPIEDGGRLFVMFDYLRRMFMSQRGNFQMARVRHAVVRIDAVPRCVVSEVLSRTCLDDAGDILEWEYDFRRSIPATSFWQKLEADLSGLLGKEIRRLRKHKLLPVLYVDMAPRQYHMFYVQLLRSTVRKLAMGGSSFVLCRRDDDSFSTVVEIPKYIIALLARNKFKIEIS